VGLGPVGLAAGLLAQAMGAERVVGIEGNAARRRLAEELGAVTAALPVADDTLDGILDLTGGAGCEVAIDCSGATAGRHLALRSTRRWGRCVLVGEGGRLEVDASPDLIHPQRTVLGSWVTSIGHMEELVERLVRWGLHPERTVTHRFGLDQADAAYAIADGGECGKVAVVMPS
jgi:threonine dehydrogenase-like Zn-dependent dehydrogenase